MQVVKWWDPMWRDGYSCDIFFFFSNFSPWRHSNSSFFLFTSSESWRPVKNKMLDFFQEEMWRWDVFTCKVSDVVIFFLKLILFIPEHSVGVRYCWQKFRTSWRWIALSNLSPPEISNCVGNVFYLHLYLEAKELHHPGKIVAL